MILLVEVKGTLCCLYGEVIDLEALGDLTVRRASHVEPDNRGRWWVELNPVGGPRLGPFGLRSTALKVEEEWLERALVERRSLAPLQIPEREYISRATP